MKRICFDLIITLQGKEACLDTQPVYGMNRPVLKVYASLNRHRDEAEVTVMGQNIIPI